CGQGAHLPYSF
nr:immunoglobulin light chain junction region [Macaca mulatta]MOW72959.1 immunoglobulin light chain junction region [Macaca mulatta]MOW73127.1 immunoglobulin light chain junction region [Macaca mulatta]MOW73396.1 immunoglobulin light chain junction region [Macaca mulatta]MOW73789.1 immunoglobulin light chain junction region [Macaca mulatta]